MIPINVSSIRRTRIQEDAIQLSSGTIAGLIGSSNCMTIDSIQETFFNWVMIKDGIAQREGREFAYATWQSAWEVFRVDIADTLQYIRKYTER